MAPNPTCPGCNGQFVEEIEDDDDPRLFIHHEHDDEEYADGSSTGGDREFPSAAGAAPAFIDPQLLQILETMLQQVMGQAGSMRFDATGSEARAAGADTQNEAEPQRQPNFPLRGMFFGAASGAAAQQQGQQTQPGTVPIQPVFTLMQQVLGFGGRESGANPSNANPSDYVWSQAGLDNIITQLMEQAQARNAPPPASEDVLNSLPMHKIGEDEVNNGMECAVCKEDFVLSEDVITLRCAHVFHNSCILPWLKVNGTCPVCRYSLVDNARGASTTTPATAATTPSNQNISGAYHSNAHNSSSSTGHDDDPMWEDITDSRD